MSYSNNLPQHFDDYLLRNRNSYPISLDGPAKPSKTNPFISFLKKIWSIIKKAFQYIGLFFKELFHKKEKSELTPKEIKILQSPLPMQHTPQSPKDVRIDVEALLDPPKNKRPSSKLKMFQQDLFTSTPEEKTKNQENLEQEKAAPIKNPVMREFYEVSQGFMENIFNSVFEEKIADSVGNVKAGLGQFSGGLKTTADLIVKFGDKAAKPLFDKLKKYKVEEKLKPEFRNLIAWLLKDVEIPNLEKLLSEALKEDFEDEEIKKEMIQATLEWLKTDHKQPFATEFEKAGISIVNNKEKINRVFEASILLLFDKKIDNFIGKCQEKLEGKLSDVIRETVVKNGKIVTDTLLRRIIDLIENTKYSNMFDTLLKAVVHQSEALIAYEEAKENAPKEVTALQKEIAAEKEKKNLSPQNLLHNKRMQEIGQEEWVKQQIEKRSAKAYAAHRFCDPKIANLLLNPDLDTADKAKIEEAIFNDLAEKIVPLLLPEQKLQLPDGTVKKVDGLVYLLSCIEIPQEFKEIIQETVDISKEIISPEMQGMVKDFYDFFWKSAGEKIQEGILSEAKRIFSKGISSGVASLFNQLTSTNILNDMMGKEALPQIQEKIFLELGWHVISTNQKTFTPLFQKLSSFNVKSNALVKKEIIKKMHERVKSYAKISTEEFQNLEFDKFFKAALPQIEQIENEMKAGRSVEDVMKEFLNKQEEVPENADYGDLTVNLLFKLGKLNKFAEFFSDWIKGPISKTISGSMDQIQSSPHFLVEKATAQIKERYSDKQAVKNLLFEKNIQKSKNIVDELFKKEIDSTAKVAHDLIFAKANASGGLTGRLKAAGIKQLFGKDQKKLANLISNIYEKAFGNRVLTQNLLFQSQRIMMTFLADASEQIELQGKSKPIKVEKLPTIIPDFLA